MQRKVFDSLAKQLNIKTLDDWYRFSAMDLMHHGVRTRGILSVHDSSIHKALTSIYPEHPWQPWRFSFVPMGYWMDVVNQRKFLDWFASMNGIYNLDDWYKIRPCQVKAMGGEGLLARYGRSLHLTLQRVYPEQIWHPWKFVPIPPRLWSTMSNQRLFFDWLGKELGYKEMEGWYNVKLEDVTERGGQTLIESRYKGCLIHALETVYSEQEWHFWRFKNIIPRGYWTKKDNHKKFFEWMKQKFDIEKLEDWRLVSRKDVTEAGGVVFLQHNHGLPSYLAALHPDIPRSVLSMKQCTTKTQLKLVKILSRHVFPDSKLIHATESAADVAA